MSLITINGHENNEESNLSKFIDSIKDRITRKGYEISEDKEYSLQSIKDLLDSLNNNQSFNNSLLTIILDFLPQSENYSLINFFNGYLKTYEKMKQNLNKYSGLNSSLIKNRIDYQKDLNKNKDESVNMHGIYSNSILRINLFLESFHEGDSCIIFKTATKERKIKLSKNKEYNEEISNLTSDDRDGYVEIINETNQENKTLDKLRLNDLLEKETKKKYYDRIQINLIWINSLVNYLNIKLNEIDSEISSNNEQILLLNHNIISLESLFPDISKDKTSNHSRENSNRTFFEHELRLSNYVENAVLKATGKSSIKWRIVVNWVNLILSLLIIPQFLYRNDMITLFISSCVFGATFQKIVKRYFYPIIYAMIGDLLLNLIWILYYMSKTTLIFQLEQKSGKNVRNGVLIIAWIELIFQIILLFSFWKYVIEVKMKVDLENLTDLNKEKSRQKPKPSKRSRLFGNHGNFEIIRKNINEIN